MLDHPAALDVGTPQASAALLTVLTIGVGVFVANLLVSIDIEPRGSLNIQCVAVLISVEAHC